MTTLAPESSLTGIAQAWRCSHEALRESFTLASDFAFSLAYMLTYTLALATHSAQHTHAHTRIHLPGYGVRLLRALVETHNRSELCGSIWDAPFRTYNFVQDLEIMLQEREQQKGPSNLGWIARLRKREHCSNMVRKQDGQVLAGLEAEVKALSESDVAPC